MNIAQKQKIVVLFSLKIIKAEMNNFGNILKKYSAPALFLLLSLLIAFIGITQEQPMIFNISALLAFAAAVFSFLFSTGRLKGGVLIVLGVVSGIAAIIVLFIVFRTIKVSNDYKNNFDTLEKKAQFLLEDIRQIQKSYLDKNGRYASDFQELRTFVKEGKSFYIVSEGTVPFRPITPEERAFLYGDNRPLDKNMTDLEAYRISKMPNPSADLANFKRDTLEQSYFESKFNKSSYLEARRNAGLGKFYIDSLGYIPETDQLWKIKTKDSVRVGDDFVSAIYVYGRLPYGNDKGKEGPKYYFGDENLSSKDLGGSWEK